MLAILEQMQVGRLLDQFYPTHGNWAAELSFGQVALAWVLQRADNIVAIPGTTKLANLKQNLGAANVKLTPAAIAKLDSLAAKVKGERYDEAGLKGVNG